MRLLLAMMKHETNTFSPVPTPLARFCPGRAAPPLGAEAIAAYRGTGTVTGGFLQAAEEVGAAVEMAIAAEAWPSGPVEDAAFETIAGTICEAVARGGWDGILLDLHGAMVTASHADGEGELVRRIRALDAETPIAVALDMHANVFPEMVERIQVLAGYQTYPHVDMDATGLRAARTLIRALRGEAKPVIAWGSRPMLPHVMRQGSDDEPNRSLQARARAMEAEGALCASLFVGFPHADVREAGLSVAVVTDGDPGRAEVWREELLDRAWEQRRDFVYEIEPLESSVARAKAMTEGPIVLLDHYDNAASGGTMDTTMVLAEILRQELEDVAAFAIYDPAAVQEAIAAGVGSEVTLSLGGKLAMPAIARPSPPLQVTARVRLISDGRYRNIGPMYTGVQMEMGPTVVLDTGAVEIVVISRHVEPHDLNCLLSLGIDPLRKRYVMLKSRVHWRAGLKELSRQVVDCAGVGVCTSDYGELRFEKVRRPIFPLDD